MSFKKFCPVCGKETENLIGKECVQCFLKREKIFSVGKLKFLVCKNCGRIQFKGEEIEFTEEALGEVIASEVKVINEVESSKIFIELEKKTNEEYEVLIKAQGIIGGNVVEQEKITSAHIKETQCDSCMKLASNYREAVIQLRAEAEEDADEMLKVAKEIINSERKGDSLSGFSNISKVTNGYDLWVGSRKAAVKAAKYLEKLYKSKIIYSKKLIGEDKTGKRKYRYTFCIKA